VPLARLKPVVTFNHFTTPIWFSARGGFEVSDSPDISAAFCGKAAGHLGGLMHLATTFNEANIQQLVQLMPTFAAFLPAAKAMIAAAANATGSPKFSTVAYADPAVSTPLLQEAHRKGYDAIKAARPDLPVGITRQRRTSRRWVRIRRPTPIAIGCTAIGSTSRERMPTSSVCSRIRVFWSMRRGRWRRMPARK